MRFAQTAALLAASFFQCLAASDAAAQSGAEAATTAAEEGILIPSRPRVPFGISIDRDPLGYGRLTTNDLIGDGQDRWRTGSVTISRAFGYGWDGTAPAQLGQLLETRLQGQIIAPANLEKFNPNDRPYAGALSFGMHTHANFDGLETALGLDLVVIGPQTRLDKVQTALHEAFNRPIPSDQVLANQIGDKIRPTVVAEFGRSYQLNPSFELRPFIEGRAGDETMARVGLDMTLGKIGQGELFSRESITGQRYRVIYASQPGTSFVLGGDVAYVADSTYLPEDRGFKLVERRDRVRAGVHWQGRTGSAFYGLTYLGPEFQKQTEGQVVGSIRLKFRF